VFERIGSNALLQMLLVASVVYALDLALAIIGWGWIMGKLSNVWNWPQHFRIYCITAVTRRLPGTLWYMLGRVVMYERLAVTRSIVAIAGGVEFAAIILAGLIVVLITWPIALSGQTLNPLWFAFGLLVCIVLLNPPVLRAAIRRMSRQYASIDLGYHHLLGWVSLYIAVWCVGGALLFVLAASIAAHPLPFARLPAIIGIWATTSVVSALLSFIPFGLGVQEVTLALLLAPLTGRDEAIVIAVLMRIVLTLNEVLWALIAGLFGFLTPVQPLLDSDQELGGRGQEAGIQPVRPTPD
jgi:hypothetical protein